MFMDWQARYYPIDVFDTLRANIETLIASGQAQSVELVREELKAVAPPAVFAWVKAQSGLFVPLDAELQSAGAAIEASYPDLADPKGIYQSADAYVIALAKVRGWTVVTQETPAAEKKNPKQAHYIPDACRELGIPCISLVGLLRQQRWRL
ncbi:MAG: DUF4411 family protein [Vicinamibacterales bacterium]